jgi:hypothetical protein
MRKLTMSKNPKLFKNQREKEKWISKAVADTQRYMAGVLEQRYIHHEGEWWLESLGKLIRLLEDDEVEYARKKGLIL